MTESHRLVSVVIPAYNAARTLRPTVDSALAQTVSDLEVIIVDDGSTDDTAAVAQAIDDPRVRLVERPNGGAAAARNSGILEARGKWVALLDSDDLWVPDKLERQLAVLQANPEVLAVQCGAYFVDDDLQVVQVRRCVQSENTLLTFLRFQNLPAALSSWVVARKMFEPMGMFDTSLEILEEWDISIKIARHCNPISMPDLLTLYRVHQGNRSHNLDIHIEPGFKVLRLVFSDPDIPNEIRRHEREIYARFYTMLCGGAFKVRRWPDCAKWGLKAVRTDPRMIGYMGALPLRRVRRTADRLHLSVSARAEHA